MLSKTRLFLRSGLILAAAGLLAWPALLSAETPQNGPKPASGLEYRLENGALSLPAFQAETTGSTALSRLSVRLYGAYSSVAAGDVNDGADGLFELLELYEALDYGTVEGRYRPVHGGYDFGADLIYQISPQIGLGLGVGYMRSSRSSLMTFTDGDLFLSVSGTPTLSAVPVRLGVFLNFPLTRELDLTVNAGGSWYAGLKFEAAERLEVDSEWQDMSLTGSRSSLSDLGVQGAIGLEYRFSPRLGFFVEAEGRYARLKNFDSVTSAYEASDGSSNTETGKLYIDTYSNSGFTYSEFVIDTTPPVDTEYDTFREPKFDLSGFSLRAGIRIRF